MLATSSMVKAQCASSNVRSTDNVQRFASTRFKFVSKTVRNARWATRIGRGRRRERASAFSCSTTFIGHSASEIVGSWLTFSMMMIMLLMINYSQLLRGGIVA